MNTLYIDINNNFHSLPDGCEVFHVDNLSLIFFIYLSTLIDVNSELEDSYLLIKNYAKENPNDYKELEKEWKKVKRRLFALNCTGTYSFPLPLGFVNWLKYGTYKSVYIARFGNGESTNVEIDLDELYDECLGRTQRLICHELEEKKGQIDEMVFSDNAVTSQSKIVKKIREQYPKIGFVRIQRFLSFASQIKSESRSQPETAPKVISVPRQWKNKDVRTFRVKGVSFDMVYVEGGEFIMRSSKYGGEAQHRAVLSSFFIGQTLVTQELWETVMDGNPSRFRGFDRPVERVSWYDCQEFVKKLNGLLNDERGNLCFSLPTESQWEYAARGGKESKGYMYSGSNNLNEVAWYEGNSGNETHPVKQKKANELGLYDMSGNVWEWCYDSCAKDYPNVPQISPHRLDSGLYRVYRGGSWGGGKGNSRVMCRCSDSSSNSRSAVGIRLALCP